MGVPGRAGWQENARFESRCGDGCSPGVPYSEDLPENCKLHMASQSIYALGPVIRNFSVVVVVAHGAHSEVWRGQPGLLGYVGKGAALVLAIQGPAHTLQVFLVLDRFHHGWRVRKEDVRPSVAVIVDQDHAPLIDTTMYFFDGSDIWTKCIPACFVSSTSCGVGAPRTASTSLPVAAAPAANAPLARTEGSQTARIWQPNEGLGGMANGASVFRFLLDLVDIMLRLRA